MKIAVSYENGQVSPHLGQSKQFKIYEVADGAATPGEVLDMEGGGHAAVTAFLSLRGVKAVISGFVGAGARDALKEAGIAVYPNVTGSADERAQQLAQGALECGPDVPAGHCGGHGGIEAHGVGHEPLRSHLGCGNHGQHGADQQPQGGHGHHKKGEFCYCQGKIVE